MSTFAGGFVGASVYVISHNERILDSFLKYLGRSFVYKS
jgi:hypothetical protein